jgi:hypothetical protein
MSLLESSEAVECWLPIVENNIMTSSLFANDNPSTKSQIDPVYSYRPDDVVTSVTGDTIEVVHSDAEGRMLLADVLALASKKVVKAPFSSFRDSTSPKLLVDFATLTGTFVLLRHILFNLIY